MLGRETKDGEFATFASVVVGKIHSRSTATINNALSPRPPTPRRRQVVDPMPIELAAQPLPLVTDPAATLAVLQSLQVPLALLLAAPESRVLPLALLHPP